MLQEGVNLTDTPILVMVQLDGQDRSTIQRGGRVLRHETPEVYMMVLKGTRDEVYYEKALQLFNKKPIYI